MDDLYREYILPTFPTRAHSRSARTDGRSMSSRSSGSRAPTWDAVRLKAGINIQIKRTTHLRTLLVSHEPER